MCTVNADGATKNCVVALSIASTYERLMNKARPNVNIWLQSSVRLTPAYAHTAKGPG